MAPFARLVPALLLAAACGSPDESEGREIEPLAVEQTEPRDIAVNGSHVFWLSSVTRGAVLSMPKTGGAPSELTEADAPHSLALNSEFLYFGESDQALKRVPLGGGDAASIALQDVTDVALGDDRAWGTSQSSDQVWSAPLQGGLLQDLGDQTYVASPTGIVVDASEVFWINRLDAEISAFPRVTGEEGGTARVVTSWTGDNTFELVANATHLFWPDHSTGELLSAPKAGGEPTVLGAATVQWLDVDGNHLYFASNEDGAFEIRRMPVEGGESELVIELEEAAGGIALDATHVYWTSPSAGTVQAVLKELP